MKKLLCFLFCFYVFTLSSKAMENDDERGSSAKIVTFAGTNISVPMDCVVEKRSGGVLIRPMDLVELHFYSLAFASKVSAYKDINRFHAIEGRENFYYQVGRIYAFIQELGSTNHQEENAAGLVKFIARLVETFVFEGKGNSYRITNERDGVTNALLNWRFCLNVNDDVMLAIISGGDKPSSKGIGDNLEKVRGDNLASPNHRFFPSFFYDAARYISLTRLFRMFCHPVLKNRVFVYFLAFFHGNGR